MYRNIIDIVYCILPLWTHLLALIVLCGFLRTLHILDHAVWNRDNFTSCFPNWMRFIFPWPIALPKTSSKWWIEMMRKKIFVLIWPLGTQLSVFHLYVWCWLWLFKFPSIHSLLSVVFFFRSWNNIKLFQMPFLCV